MIHVLLKYVFIAMIFLIGFYPLGSVGDSLDNYTIYHGDVDGNGILDYYFKGGNKVLIVHGDPSMPVVYKKYPEGAVLKGNGGSMVFNGRKLTGQDIIDLRLNISQRSENFHRFIYDNFVSINNHPISVRIRVDEHNQRSHYVEWSGFSNVATRYEIKRLRNSEIQQIYTISGDLNSRLMSNIPPGNVKYHVRACYVESGETICSSWANSEEIQVRNVPAAPAMGNVGYHTNGSFSLSWGSVSSAVSYIVQERDSGGNWLTIQGIPSTHTTIYSKPNGVYGYRVQACNANGCGDFSRVISVSVPFSAAIAYGQPGISVGPGPYQTITTNNGYVSITYPELSWDAWYEVLIRNAQTKAVVYDTIYSGIPGNNFVVGPLQNGTYYISLYSCEEQYGPSGNYCDFGAFFNATVIVAHVPSIPRNFYVPEKNSTGQYTITWAAPSSGAATRYELERLNNNGVWSRIRNAAVTSYQELNRNNGQYRYRVRACNANGCGAYTAALSAQVLLLPGAPGEISAIRDVGSESSYTLNWGKSTGSVSSYRLEKKLVSDGGWQSLYEGMNNSYRASGIDREAYQFRVKACNQSGCGTYSPIKLVNPFSVSGAFSYDQPMPPALVSESFWEEHNKVGAVAGQFQVTETGASSYTIPLELPVGTAGVAPQLALTYSSQSGNGLLGIGWSLGGLSGISRCRQTLGQDGQALPITWGANDRFCLDGQRLLLTSTDGKTYGQPGSIYRTEIDTFVQVTAVGGSNGRPSYFLVARKDGSTAYYGQTSDSRQMAGAQTHIWNMNRFTDNVGNGVDYVYGHNGGRIEEIRYAYGSGADPQAKIQFKYEERSDVLDGYISGYRFRVNNRLKTIELHTGYGLHEVKKVNSYELGYENSGNSINKTSRINSIKHCSLNSSMCLSTTNFTWEEHQFGFDQRVYNSLANDQTSSQLNNRHLAAYTPIDINGDGFMDMAWIEHRGGRQYLRYSLSENGRLISKPITSSFGTIQHSAHNGMQVSSNSNERFILRVLDYNADGRQDLALYSHTSRRWRILLADSSNTFGWTLSSEGVHNADISTQGKFVDINSDGLIDQLVVEGNKIYRRLLERKANVQDPGSNQAYGFSDRVQMHIAGLPNDMPSGISPNAVTVELIDGGFGDFNGDGKADVLVAYTMTRDNSWPLVKVSAIYALTSNGNNQLSYYATLDLRQEQYSHDEIYNEDDDVYYYPGTSSSLILGRYHAVDMNGDGLTDIVMAPSSSTSYQVKLSTGTGFSENPVVLQGISQAQRLTFLDYNRDGFPDILWGSRSLGGSPPRFDRPIKARIWKNTDESVECTGSSSACDDVDIDKTHDFENIQMIDVNGDGLPDAMSLTTSSSLASIRVHYAKGGDKPRDVIIAIDNGMDFRTEITYKPINKGSHYERFDTEGSETMDSCMWDYDLGDYECQYYNRPDRTGFYTKLNGNWDYTGVVAGNTQTLGKHSPVLEAMGPMLVVAEVASTAPAATSIATLPDQQAKTRVKYSYSEARMQASGRGFLGFHKLATEDQQTGIRTVTTYRQDFPFIGYPIKTEVFTREKHLLSRSTNIWRLKGWQNNWPSRSNIQSANFQGTQVLGPLLPVLTESVEETFALENNGITQGELLQTVTTQTPIGQYDHSGNPWRVIISTADNSGRVVTKTTNNQYGATIQGNTWYQRMGRLTRSTVTTQDNTGAVSPQRIVNFTYYPEGSQNNGLLRREITGPDTEQLIVEYEYTERGNQSRVTRIGHAGHETQQRSVSYHYDPHERFVEKTVNAYGQVVEEILGRNSRGQPTHINVLPSADANGLQRFIRYDRFGRVYLEEDQTGAYAHTVMTKCGNECPVSASYYTTVTTAGGGSSQEYFDPLGRTVRKGTAGFQGQWVYVDIEYNAAGQVQRQSNPHTGSPLYWTVMEYDLVGRVTSTQMPGITNPVTVAYGALDTVTTNPTGQSQTEVRDAFGHMASVIDNLGGRINYHYTLDGQLRSATTLASGSNPVSVTLCYDNMGRKRAMHDPDKGGFRASATTCPTAPQAGWWFYKYNAFGELVEQTDAAGNISRMTYDRLGRMTNRNSQKAGSGGLYDSNSFWAYNNTSSWADDVPPGALGLMYDPVTGYRQYYAYDAFGRPSRTLTQISAGDEVTTAVNYDQYGRVFQQFDAAPTGHNAIQHQYNAYGYLSRVIDARTHQPYYTVRDTDMFGNITETLSGNGVTTYRHHNPLTGRLRTIQSGLLGTLIGNVQDLAYTWDDLGNLTWRREYSGGKNLEERFEYDGLNRLTRSRVTGGNRTDVSYNGRGNITSKNTYIHAGIRVAALSPGNYTYGGNASGACQGQAGPHAVTLTSDGACYAYDNNGNMTRDNRGRNLEYTSYDMVSRISRNGRVNAFKYAPDRARYERKDTDAQGNLSTVTHYLGNVERLTHADGKVVYKRYLPGGTLVEVEQAQDGLLSQQTRYLHTDHLGSVDVITDQWGAIVQELSFDAWGLRRSAVTWDDASLNQLVANLPLSHVAEITPRGYTGHEMLDDVGLIHMNGRVYDARLGRFLQADPFIQSAGNTQNYNRYSYVLNNPLAYTDPSGYFFKKIWNKIRPFVGTLVALAVPLVCPACSAFTAGMIGGLMGAAANGGNAWQIAMSAFTGGMAGVSWGAGVLASGFASLSMGGRFEHGVLAAGIGVLGGRLSFGAGPVGSFIITTIAGGVATEVTGGKFRNGASTAAFNWALSQGVKSSFAPKDSRIRSGGPERFTEEQRLDIQKEIHLAVNVDKVNDSGFNSSGDGAVYLREKLQGIAEKYDIEIGAYMPKVGGRYIIKDVQTTFHSNTILSMRDVRVGVDWFHTHQTSGGLFSYNDFAKSRVAGATGYLSDRSGLYRFRAYDYGVARVQLNGRGSIDVRGYIDEYKNGYWR